MNIDNLSGNAATALIKTMMEKGLLSDAEITEAAIKNPSHGLKIGADLVHTLLCPHHHSPEGKCDYYNEELVDESEVWGGLYHQFWMRFTVAFIERHNITDIGATLERIGSIIRTFSSLSESLGLDVIEILKSGISPPK